MNAILLRLLALGSIVIAACDRGSGAAKPADSVASASTPGITTAAVPFYEIFGHHSEKVYDYVKAADWVAARASVDSLNAAMRSAGSQDTVGHGVKALESMSKLDSAVARRSRAEGLAEANRLTQMAALLGAAHDPPVPAYVTLLDYYGRELEIGTASKDAARLSRAALAIKTTWNEVRPRVVSQGGIGEAARFDSVVTQVTAARTPAQYGNVAPAIRDQVAALEAVFRR